MSNNTSNGRNFLLKIFGNRGPVFNQIMLYFISFSFSFGMGYLLKGLTFPVTYYISERAAPFTVYFYVKDISDLILGNLFFPIFALYIRIRLIEMTRPSYGEKDEGCPCRLCLGRSDILYVILLGLYIFGNTSHVLSNRFNAITPEGTFNYKFVFIYFWDEYFGHLAIGCGLFGMALLNMIEQLRINETLDMHGKGFFLFNLAAVLFYGVFAFAMIEGQSSIPLVFFNAAVIVYSVYVYMEKRRAYPGKNEKRGIHPALYFYTLGPAVFILTVAVYAIVTGVRPFYPFLYQPGELGW